MTSPAPPICSKFTPNSLVCLCAVCASKSWAEWPQNERHNSEQTAINGAQMIEAILQTGGGYGFSSKATQLCLEEVVHQGHWQGNKQVVKGKSHHDATTFMLHCGDYCGMMSSAGVPLNEAQSHSSWVSNGKKKEFNIKLHQNFTRPFFKIHIEHTAVYLRYLKVKHDC